MQPTEQTLTDSILAEEGAFARSTGDAPTVGEMLRERRESLGLTHRDLSAITKIQAAHLQYLEENRFDEFSAEVFCRGFLKNYARELRLDGDEMIEAYEAQTGRASQIIQIVESEPAPVQESRFAHPNAMGRVVYGAALALFIVGLALSVLIFGGGNEQPSAAYQPADYSDSWQPVAPTEDDWQSQREN